MTVRRFIYKYPIETTDEQEIEMPRAAVIRHVGTQPILFDQIDGVHIREWGQLTVWAEVDPSQPTVKRIIRVHGTGHPITHPENGGVEFIGTVFDGPFVWHVYDAGWAPL